MAQEIIRFTADFSSGESSVEADFSTNEDVQADFGSVMRSGGGVTNYERLTHKPSINETELRGNKSFEDLGLKDLSNIEIASIVNRVFD